MHGEPLRTSLQITLLPKRACLALCDWKSLDADRRESLLSTKLVALFTKLNVTVVVSNSEFSFNMDILLYSSGETISHLTIIMQCVDSGIQYVWLCGQVEMSFSINCLNERILPLDTLTYGYI